MNDYTLLLKEFLKLLGILGVAVTGSLSNKEAMEKFGEKLTVPHTKIEEISERLISLASYWMQMRVERMIWVLVLV